MASDPVVSSFDRRTWLRVGALIIALLLVPITAWILLGSTPSVTIASTASARKVRAPTVADSAPTSEQAATRSLAGKVADDAGNPIGSVTVTFLPTGHSASRHTIRTDEDGSFFLDNVPVDGGALSAKLEGWVGTPIMIGPDANDVTGLTLRIHQAAGVKGQVVDSEGKPVDHATVSCDDGKGQATSSADGTYTLAIDDEGCTATAKHPDFGASEPSRVRAGTRNILELPSPGGIAGVVLDEQGKPVPSFMVSVESFVPTDKEMDRLGGLAQQFTDPGGAFDMKGLARGKYVLGITAPGHPPARSDTIDVSAGRTTRGVRVTFSKGISLSGVITDRATHQPLKGVRVSLDAMTSAGPSGIPAVTSDDAGAYSIEGVPAGAFSVRFSHPQYSERIITLDGRGKTELRGDVDLATGSATEMSGIGATLGQGAGFVLITQVIPGGPAEGAGIKSGDHIVRVDGDDASSFTVSDCIQRLRGPEGTVVMVTIEHDGARRDVRITRARIVR